MTPKNRPLQRRFAAGIIVVGCLLLVAGGLQERAERAQIELFPVSRVIEGLGALILVVGILTWGILLFTQIR